MTSTDKVALTAMHGRRENPNAQAIYFDAEDRPALSRTMQSKAYFLRRMAEKSYRCSNGVKRVIQTISREKCDESE
jgi:hypothetical protein